MVALLALACREEELLVEPPVSEGVGSTVTFDVPGPVDADEDGFVEGEDCDDADAAVYPGAPDVCGDDRVTDCDRTSDDGLVTVAGSSTFEDLQDALQSAEAFAEVLICPGTYTGVFRSARPVVLRSHAGAELTVLDGAGQGTTLTVTGSSEVIGLTLTGGRTPEGGGGLRTSSEGGLTVTDCVVRGNEARDGGGIYLVTKVAAVISGTTISGNTAQFTGGGLGMTEGTADLTGSTITGNTAQTGGGLWLIQVDLWGGLVTANTAEVAGGVSASLSRLEGVAVEGNSAQIAGGLVASDEVEIVGGQVVDNVATERAGGVSADIGVVNLEGVTIADNQAPLAAGLDLGYGVQGNVTDSVFARNVADMGGGILLGEYAALSVVTSDFGEGADANQPEDVNASAAYPGYGADASFTCDPAGCTPAP